MSILGPNVVPISERSAEANQGAPGQWEGDLIIGAHSQSAALTLVERSTNFQIVYALPNGYQADRVIDALVRWVQTTPAEMCESLTWDRGSEIAHWQLRFWFPKGIDLRTYSQADYDQACAVLNSQPRRQYGLQSADERYADALACTDR